MEGFPGYPDIPRNGLFLSPGGGKKPPFSPSPAPRLSGINGVAADSRRKTLRSRELTEYAPELAGGIASRGSGGAYERSRREREARVRCTRRCFFEANRRQDPHRSSLKAGRVRVKEKASRGREACVERCDLGYRGLEGLKTGLYVGREELCLVVGRVEAAGAEDGVNAL